MSGVAAALGRGARAILQRGIMLAPTPIGRLGLSSPRALAERLLDEIDHGHVPVWPSTERHAERLVEGLELLMEERGRTVVRAILAAPHPTPLDWPDRLRRLRS